MKRILSLMTVLALLVLASSTTAAYRGDDSEDWLQEGAARHGLSVAQFMDALSRQESGNDMVLQVRGDPESYGGVYFDWAAETPSFVVQYTGAAPADDFGASIRLVRVERSFALLERVRDELASVARTSDPSESGFVSVAIDEPNNTVRLVVTDLGTPFAEVASKFGQAVSVEVGDRPTAAAACNNRENCIPFRGGIKISSGQYDCSYGMNARRNNGYLVMVTAGHCDWTANHTWRHLHAQGGSTLIGTANLNGLHNGKDVDVVRVSATGANVQNPYNRVYSTDVNNNLAITGAVSNNNIFSGMAIRRVGFKTSKNGQVTGGRMFYSFWWEGWWRFAWGFPSDATSIGGDSGGTVFRTGVSTNALAGFNSMQEGIFASQEDAKIVLDLSHFCITNAC